VRMVDTADKVAKPPTQSATIALAPLAAALAIGGLVGYYALTTKPMWLRWLTLALGLLLGAGALSVSAIGRTVWEFAMGSRIEVRKMVWPTKEVTWQTTLIVFGFVILLGLFFWFVDWLLGMGTRRLIGGGT